MRNLLLAIIAGIVVSSILAVISIYIGTTNYVSRIPTINSTPSIIIVPKYPVAQTVMDNTTISPFYFTVQQVSYYSRPIILSNPVIVTNNSKAYTVIGIKNNYNSTLYILEQEGYYIVNISKINEEGGYIYYNVTFNFEFKPKELTIILVPIWDSTYHISSYIIIILQPGTINSSIIS
ncbi:MAG: hypothetical protein QXV69_04315 [Sulfolobaceae archaeon]